MGCGLMLKWWKLSSVWCIWYDDVMRMCVLLYCECSIDVVNFVFL